MNEMVGWHHWLNGHAFEQASGVGGILQSMGSQRVGHEWVTELNLSNLNSQRNTVREEKKKKGERKLLKNSPSNGQSGDSKSLAINNYSKYKSFTFFN